jgi:hypothetical protein
MSITDLSAETTILASPKKDLNDLQVVSLFAVVGLLVTAAVAALGVDVTQALNLIG